MSQNITLLGASYTNVPGVQLPKTGGGTALFTDVTDTTAAAADVASGKYFYTAAGTRTQGTASGGGGATLKTATKAMTSNATSISFSSLSGNPLAFAVEPTGNISLTSSSNTRYVAGVFFDGESTTGLSFALTGSRAASVNYNTSNFTKSYSSGTLTISSNSSTSGGYFRSGVTYKLIYIY